MGGEENPFENEDTPVTDLDDGSYYGSSANPLVPAGVRHRHRFLYNIAQRREPEEAIQNKSFGRGWYRRGLAHLSWMGSELVETDGVRNVPVLSRDTSDKKQSLWCDASGRLFFDGNYMFRILVDKYDTTELPSDLDGYAEGFSRDTGDNPWENTACYKTWPAEKWLLWAENARFHEDRLDLSRAVYRWYKATLVKHGNTLLPGSLPKHRPFKYPKGPKGRLSVARHVHFSPSFGTDHEERFNNVLSLENGSVGDAHIENRIVPDMGSAINSGHSAGVIYDENNEPYYVRAWALDTTYPEDYEDAADFWVDWSTWPGTLKCMYWNPMGGGPAAPPNGPDIFAANAFDGVDIDGEPQPPTQLPDCAFDMVMELTINKYCMFSLQKVTVPDEIWGLYDVYYAVRSGQDKYFNTHMKMSAMHLLAIPPKKRSL